MKKLACIILIALIVLCPLVSSYAAAAPKAVFVSVNEKLLRDVTPETMPRRINSQMYVHYEVIDNMVGMRTHYNKELKQLSVYNFDYRLIFDLSTNEVWDEKYVSYTYKAVDIGGKIFVPIRTVCEKFEFIYSYLAGAKPAPIIRLNQNTPPISDDAFVQKSKVTAEGLYELYDKTYVNPPSSIDPDITDLPSEPSPEPTVKSVYLTFEGDINEYTETILDKLEAAGRECAFFITPHSALQYPQTVRRMFALGNSVGIYLDVAPQTADEMRAALAYANEVMRSVIKTKGSLLRVDGGSKSLASEVRDCAVEHGYRIWDYTADVKSATATQRTIVANTELAIKNADKQVVLRLFSNKETAAATTQILSAITREKHTFLTINEWTTPINSARDYR